MKLGEFVNPTHRRGGGIVFVKLVALIAALFCCFTATFAYFTAKAQAKGEMQFADISVQAVTSDDEVYTSQTFASHITTKIKPGDDYTIKDIYVKNTGECDVYALLELTLDVKKENSTEVSYTKTYWFNFEGTELTGTIQTTTVEASFLAKAARAQTTIKIQIPGELDNTYKRATADVTIHIHAIQSQIEKDSDTTVAATASRLIYLSKSKPINTAYYKRIDKDGTPNENGEYILFGMYPQTIKSSDVTIDETDVDANGYYLGSDGERYAKRKVKVGYYYTWNGSERVQTSTFTDGTTFTYYTEYYFKVEPIKWRILTTKHGKAVLFAEDILEAESWDSNYGLTYYKDSRIHNWLNSTFFDLAFDTNTQTAIQTTEVDNSLNCGNNEETACENTLDKVFLLSSVESTSSNYGLNSESSRQKVVSDYARIMFATVGYWWTRTSNYFDKTYNSNNVINWHPNGGGNSAVAVNTMGVAPVVTILL